eukprot:snap_masked-scaffold_45-processed-gene-1.42-mRNA-1 protein AED:1.00 eAED:1.00 QI:0/0/0/0/1/1/2/0/409
MNYARTLTRTGRRKQKKKVKQRTLKFSGTGERTLADAPELRCEIEVFQREATGEFSTLVLSKEDVFLHIPSIENKITKVNLDFFEVSKTKRKTGFNVFKASKLVSELLMKVQRQLEEERCIFSLSFGANCFQNNFYLQLLSSVVKKVEKYVDSVYFRKAKLPFSKIPFLKNFNELQVLGFEDCKSSKFKSDVFEVDLVDKQSVQNLHLGLKTSSEVDSIKILYSMKIYFPFLTTLKLRFTSFEDNEHKYLPLLIQSLLTWENCNLENLIFEQISDENLFIFLNSVLKSPVLLMRDGFFRRLKNIEHPHTIKEVKGSKLLINIFKNKFLFGLHDNKNFLSIKKTMLNFIKVYDFEFFDPSKEKNLQKEINILRKYFIYKKVEKKQVPKIIQTKKQKRKTLSQKVENSGFK